MKIDSSRTSQIIRHAIITAICLLLFLSCNSDPGVSDETGALAVKFSYNGSAGGFRPLAAKLDCDQTGVANIVAAVYDENHTEMKRGDWECKDGEGTIEAVKAGSDRTVVIVGKDAEDNIIFRGQRTGIKIFGGKVNETGEIECDDFVPRLASSNDGKPVMIGAIRLEWEAVDGAKEYKIFLSEDSNMSSASVKTSQKPYYELQDMLPNQKNYYWQVVAVDDHNNESAKSEIRSFVTLLYSSIAAGYEHTLAIKEGTLWSWGRNSHGQLGHGDNGPGTERAKPTRVGNDTDWVHVTAGPNYSVALKADGTMYSWGCNANQVLGHGSGAALISSVPTPTKIKGDQKWVYMAAGDRHMVAINTQGDLWAWGSNDHGQFGRGNADKDPQPTPTFMNSTGWVCVAAGPGYSFGIKAGGQLWAWGNNSESKLGLSEPRDYLEPVRIGSASDWAYVSTSGSHAVALKASGELWVWGSNSHGQLGHKDGIDASVNLIPVGSDKNWTHAVAAEAYTLAVNAKGEIWAWGRNEFGQLGLDDTVDRDAGEKVSGDDWTFISARGNHVVAVTGDDGIWSWGKNTFGETGKGTQGLKRQPVQVGEATDWAGIAHGYCNSFTLATKTNGELWGWGLNHFGQLGLGNVDHQQVPTKVGDGGGWGTVANGDGLTIGVKKSSPDDEGGPLLTWGQGYLGGGNSDTKHTPTKIGEDEQWGSVAAGKSFFIALKETDTDENRTLWVWGSNKYGQLGLGDSGSSTDRYSPTQVGTDTTWKVAAGGGFHAVALKSDGTLWSWGRGTVGQHGQGDEEDRLLPTQIGTQSDWKFVAAGSYHTVAIKDDGTLWTWGYNVAGQLGHDDEENKLVPFTVETGSTQWLYVAAGYNHTAAISSDGTLWAWGANKMGQLGNTSLGTGKTTKPHQITEDTDWAFVGASGYYTVAIKKDGTLWSWGHNDKGELGHGDAWISSPTQVSLE